jgi:uncharacterized protein with von Willebrand factor type A (vWA) domain
MAANIVAFSRFLRRGGFPAHPSTALDACRSVAAIDLSDPRQVYWALRANFVTCRDHLAPFDRLYALFWEQGAHLLPGEASEPPTRPQAGTATAEGEDTAAVLVPEDPAVGGASDLEVLRKKDLRHLLPVEQDAVRAALQAILAKLTSRPSRRRRLSAHGDEIAFRHVFRRNALYGSDILHLTHRTPRIGKRRLVFVGDVSGSMDTYAGFFLLLAHALARRDRGAEVYAFSTRLFRLTEFVQDRDATRAVARVAEQTRGWSGGTRLGQCLGELNQALARGRSRRPTAVIVFSDGWDRGDPDTLQREIVRLKHASRRILWLNPLLGDPGYQPLSRGMATVLPYLDGFHPAHNIESLVRFSRELVRTR